MRWISLVFVLSLALPTIGFAKAQNKGEAKVRPNIVGGLPANAGEFQFMASLQSSSSGHFCGGTLIKKNWVLTAAHCINSSLKNVYVGLYNLKRLEDAESFTPVQTIVHPNYSYQSEDYDFALIQLSADSQHEPVQLNSTDLKIPANPAQAPLLTTAGWGVTVENGWKLPDILRKVDVPLVPESVCNASYSGAITDRMICAGYQQGGKDSCQGDSGGPLFGVDASTQAISLVGVVSWGEGCAAPNKYGVYSKVSAVYDWITKTAN